MAAAVRMSVATALGASSVSKALRTRCLPRTQIPRRYSTTRAAMPKDVSVGEANELNESGACTYLDVRTPEEFSAGHTPGAVNIPLMFRSPAGMAPNPDFTGSVQQQFPDISASLLVGCKSGARSARACAMLAADKYENLMNVVGGFDAWVAAGLKVEK